MVQAKTLLNRTKRQKEKFEPKTPIANEMFLPNHSGDLGAGLFKLTDGSVIFAENLKLAQDNSNFHWDNDNKRLGIGTATPSADLHVDTNGGNILFDVDLVEIKDVGGDDGILRIGGATGGQFGITQASATRVPILVRTHASNSVDIINVDTSKFVLDENGNVGIGTATPVVLFQTKGGDIYFGEDGDVSTEIRINSGIAGKYFEMGSYGTYSNFTISGSQNFNILSRGVSGYITILTHNANRMRIKEGLSFGRTFYSTDPGDDNVIIEGKLGVATTTPTILLSANEKTGFSELGGTCIKLTNKTGANSIKGYCVTNSDTTADAVRLVPVDEPNPIGVFLESGVSDGSEAWIVVGGIADVYFWGSTTLGDMARTGLTADTGEVAGQAMSEASPTSPFSVDKHFCEVGHVLEARTGAGLARVAIHFN